MQKWGQATFCAFRTVSTSGAKSSLSPFFALTLLAFAAGAEPPKKLQPPPDHHRVQGVTRCELCHSTSGWAGAHFAHERTGFPLDGRHRFAPCHSCHVANEFKAPLPRSCSGCHRDAHRGELGQRCEGCHNPDAWVSMFTVDAHRRTAFPLEGKHATIPCTECHGEARDRRFSRPVTGCFGCHQADYARTRFTAIDHETAGFPTDCQQCHDPFRFRPARFPQHDACFPISRGAHAGIPCSGCHAGTPSVTGTLGTCATFTAACTQCHSGEHACTRMNEKHREVAGYQCVDRKCYECHRFGEGD